jgi:hypothetical protein
MGTLAAIDALVKLNYGNRDRIQRAQWKEFAALARIKKKSGAANASGGALVAPVIYGNVQSFSTTVANQQTVAATSGGSLKSKRWVVPYGTYGASVVFERKMLKLAVADIGVYLDAKKEEIDGMYRQWNQIFSWYLLNAKNRALGSFTISTGVCSMINVEDIVNISPGMLVQASANDGSSTGHTLLGSGSIGYVIGVNYNDGTFTVSTTDGGAAGTPASWTGTMYVFRYGDFGGTAAPGVICDGFGDWCPSSDPTSTPFNNIDRTANIVALSGTRLTSAAIASLTNEQRIKRLVTAASARGFMPLDYVFVSPEKWQDIADGMEARGMRDIAKKDPTFGFESLTVLAGGQSVEVLSDRFQPSARISAWNKDAFALHYPDGFPEVVNDDGLQMLRKTTTNDYELRLEAFPATLGTPAGMATCAAA